MDIINNDHIKLINNTINNLNSEGLFFFISDRKYSKFVSPLTSSINLFAKNWLIIYIQIGCFSFDFKKKDNLIEIGIDIPSNIKNKNELKIFSANIRVPILFEFTSKINTNKIIYSDVDNILINNINSIFNEKRIYLRQVRENLIEKKFIDNSKFMQYKSGIIILKANDNKYLRNDSIITSFVESYYFACIPDFDKWFSDQIALTKTFNENPELIKYTFFNKKICDWDLNPSSYFWAAKGYIKDTLLWKIISLKNIIIFNLKLLIDGHNNRLYISIIYVIDRFLKFFIFPLIVLRLKLINFCFRFIRFTFKKIIKLFKFLIKNLLNLLSN